jgi:hypothetical protein
MLAQPRPAPRRTRAVTSATAAAKIAQLDGSARVGGPGSPSDLIHCPQQVNQLRSNGQRRPRGRHVGRTEAQLRARLAQQPGIPAASTFATLKEAESVVAAALRANRGSIQAWAKTATPGMTKAFTHNAGRVIDEGVVRSTGQLTKMSQVVVVVRKVISQNRVYFVLTAYPK